GEDEVREDWSELDVEGFTRRSIDARTDEVRRDEIGCELQAYERPADGVRERLDSERLGESGYTFHEAMPLGQQADEDSLHHAVLPHDDALHLEQRALEVRRRRRFRSGRSLVRHLGLPGSGARRVTRTQPPRNPHRSS